MSALVSELRRSRLPAPSLARAIRVSAGVSQVRLAEELGVHRVTVARWEAGTWRPRGPIRERYMKLLHELEQVAGDE